MPHNDLIDQTPFVQHVYFDAEKFGKRVSEGMVEDRFSCRDLAKILGLGHATVSRIAKGEKPDVDTLIKLLHWLGEDSTEYVKVMK